MGVTPLLLFLMFWTISRVSTPKMTATLEANITGWSRNSRTVGAPSPAAAAQPRPLARRSRADPEVVITGVNEAIQTKPPPNNYRIDRISGDPSVIARSPCDEAIQEPQPAGRQQ